MSIREEAIEQFEFWLPGELVYSAQKAGYDKKISRAALPIEDRQSIYGFLGSEWDNHQLLKQQDAHFKPFHGMSGQLQLAKFAAGLIDKAGVSLWLASGNVDTEAAFVESAQHATVLVQQIEPWKDNNVAIEFDDEKFENTPFADGIIGIMRGIVRANSEVGTDKRKACSEVIENSLVLGGLAVRCYQNYAEAFLSPDQLVLPNSEPKLVQYLLGSGQSPLFQSEFLRF